MRRRRSRWRHVLRDAKTDKGIDWSYFFKRYVWDDEITPYFFPVARLHRGQASSELFAYTLFVGILFFFVALLTSTSKAPSGPAPVMSLYCFSVACAAVVLAMTKQPLAAMWCSASPAVLLAYFFLAGFPPRLETIDQALIGAVLVLITWYGGRVVRIARAYPELPEPPEDE